MSNTIQMKRGSGKPDGKLAPYELGIDISDGQLYYGGSISNSEYGKAQGIKVAKAEGAIKIVDENGVGLTIGTATTPIYLEGGKFKTCGGSSISTTVERAEMLATPREIKVDLAVTGFAKFSGQYDITTGVTGILPVTKGGTGAATADEARVELGAAAATDLNNYLPLSGGTLTGALTLGGALDCANNGIIKIKSLQFNDTAGEGILFPRAGSGDNVTAWDKLWANDGKLYFSPTYGTTSVVNYNVYHTGNFSNSFTRIATDQTLDKESNITINNVKSKYSFYIFFGLPAADENSGYTSLFVPKHFIPIQNADGTIVPRRFCLSDSLDTKMFSLIFENENLVIRNVDYIGAGFKKERIQVYGCI